MIVVPILLIVVWAFGAGITVACMQPDNPGDGVLVLVLAVLGWPLIAVGWLVSRPWANRYR